MGSMEPPGPCRCLGQGWRRRQAALRRDFISGYPSHSPPTLLATPALSLAGSPPLTSKCWRNWVLFASLYPLSPADLIQTHGVKHHLYLTILNLHLPSNLSQTPDAYLCLPDISPWMSDRSKIECLISHPPQPVPPTVYPTSVHDNTPLLLAQVRRLRIILDPSFSQPHTPSHSKSFKTTPPSRYPRIPPLLTTPTALPGPRPPSSLPQTTRLPWPSDSKPIFLLILFLLALPTSFPASAPLGLHSVP